MTSPVFTVRTEMKIWEAIELLIKKRISGSPLVDGMGHVQGIVSRSNILRLFIEAHYGKKIAKPA